MAFIFTYVVIFTKDFFFSYGFGLLLVPFSFNLKNTFSVSCMAVLLPINSLSLYPSRDVLGLPQWLKNLPAVQELQETWVQSLVLEHPLE